MSTEQQITEILHTINANGLDVSSFLIGFIQSAAQDHKPAQCQFFSPESLSILYNTLHSTPSTIPVALAGAKRAIIAQSAHKITSIMQKAAGYHFNAAGMSAERIEKYSVEAMDRNMRASAPLLWELFSTFLRTEWQAAPNNQASEQDGSASDGHGLDEGEGAVRERPPKRQDEDDGPPAHIVDDDGDPEWVNEPLDGAAAGGGSSSESDEGDGSKQKGQK
ncbi:hypothetical protein BOTBODRAFT_173273 [Botryobasidium botryosum FD-172 SS1]|uniref:Uncharacterized protein n=1 Tax=Botryobasidium botryosum (strain FD-172 SS1) TaxID=930990 RepID=A0A067MX11_BOTB1|nr:hypothetical protein BOTBODRAFT_173273 [Botryobasidium botryosum FD-172 SS1]